MNCTCGGKCVAIGNHDPRLDAGAWIEVLTIVSGNGAFLPIPCWLLSPEHVNLCFRRPLRDVVLERTEAWFKETIDEVSHANQQSETPACCRATQIIQAHASQI